MKYVVRSLKYFVYICLIMTLILVVLAAFGMISKDVNVMFRNGYTSILEIAGMFFCISWIYPKFGFCRRTAMIPGEFGEIRDGVVEFMESRKYTLEKEECETLTFRLSSTLSRLTRMCEDRVTMTRALGGFEIEGLTKDVTRLVYGLEYKFRHGEEE